MTVEQLIKKLRKYPEDTEVLIGLDFEDYKPELKYYKNSNVIYLFEDGTV